MFLLQIVEVLVRDEAPSAEIGYWAVRRLGRSGWKIKMVVVGGTSGERERQIPSAC